MTAAKKKPAAKKRTLPDALKAHQFKPKAKAKPAPKPKPKPKPRAAPKRAPQRKGK